MCSGGATCSLYCCNSQLFSVGRLGAGVEQHALQNQGGSQDSHQGRHGKQEKEHRCQGLLQISVLPGKCCGRRLWIHCVIFLPYISA